jgi:hypothetical protein
MPFLEQRCEARILRGQRAQEVLFQVAEGRISFQADQRPVHLLRRGAETP